MLQLRSLLEYSQPDGWGWHTLHGSCREGCWSSGQQVRQLQHVTFSERRCLSDSTYSFGPQLTALHVFGVGRW
jgi:hypothetical protein